MWAVGVVMYILYVSPLSWAEIKMEQRSSPTFSLRCIGSAATRLSTPKTTMKCSTRYDDVYTVPYSTVPRLTHPHMMRRLDPGGRLRVPCSALGHHLGRGQGPDQAVPDRGPGQEDQGRRSAAAPLGQGEASPVGLRSEVLGPGKNPNARMYHVLLNARAPPHRTSICKAHSASSRSSTPRGSGRCAPLPTFGFAKVVTLL